MTNKNPFNPRILDAFVTGQWGDLFDTVLKDSALGDVKYPPINIVKYPATDRQPLEYKIELACAGFSENEIKVEREGNVLVVSGRKIDPDVIEDENGNQITKTILRTERPSETIIGQLGRRAWVRKFAVEKMIKVSHVSYADGILTIRLEAELPAQTKETYEINRNVEETKRLLVEEDDRQFTAPKEH